MSINAKMDLIDEHNQSFDPGENPLVLALSHKQFRDWCRSRGISERKAVYGTPRSTQGLRPSSIVKLPDWYLREDLCELLDGAERTTLKMPSPVPVHYVMEGRFLAVDAGKGTR